MLKRFVGIVDALGFSMSVQITDSASVSPDFLAHRKRAVKAAIDKDYAAMLEALGFAARAYGMSQLARHTQLRREALYRSFSATGDPTLHGFCRVLSALGLSFKIVPLRKRAKIR